MLSVSAMSSNLEVPNKFRRGNKKCNQPEHVASAVWLIQLLSRVLGTSDLSETEVLDMGCGTKLVQALLDHQLPVKRYVGIDIYREMIEFLRGAVQDKRLSFYHMDTHNEMYNPGGSPLRADTGLPIGADSFDMICLFSVFTHLAPHDYREMLRLLRPYAKADGKLVFSLFVNEETEGGYGHIDDVARVLKNNAQLVPSSASSRAEVPDFVDSDPERPLTWALYSRSHALNLVEGTGWEVESLNDPEEYIQHYMICRPI